MSHRIITAYEPTDQGRDALGLGELLTRMTDGSMLVACVYPHEPALYEGSDGYQAALRAGAEETLSDVAAHVTVRAETRAVMSPPPARGLRPAQALIELAEQESADILVVGSCHRGRIGRILLGSVGERLLHGAPCSVAVAPTRFRDRNGDVETIVVAFDLGAEAQAALDRAVDLATATGASLRVVSAVEPLDPVLASANPTYFANWSDWDKRLEDAQQRARERLPAEAHAEFTIHKGVAGDVIRQSTRDADLLVMGSRGQGAAGRALLGSVSARVIRGAPCPVLVVPRAAARAAQHSSLTARSAA